MIEVVGLHRRYGDVVAVDDVSFRVEPGQVTGLLGPNGAGKTTTLRAVLGLTRPTAGAATVAGRPYRQLEAPLRVVGALLDADAVHPGRRAVDHLRWVAATHDLPRRRVDEVLDEVGLGDAADRRVRGFSLGMRQRLGIAAALLGDPAALVLDEPVNGLDTQGIRWVRQLMRRLASEGRTVLVASHLMDELERTVDHVVVVARGRIVADAALTTLAPTRGSLEDVYTDLVAVAPSSARDDRGVSP